MQQPIAYVMSRFPHLPETFILREMTEMERLGWSIHLYPLMLQQQTIVHPEAHRWLATAQSSPFFSRTVLGATSKTLVKQPRTLLAILGRTVAEYWRTPSELVRALALLPKALTMAHQMQTAGIAHIHAHYATYPAFAAWVIHRLTGISYSLTIHAHDIFVSQTMLQAKLQAASAVVVISEFNREFIAQHVGDWVRAKTHVIHCGINPANYSHRQDSPATTTRFEILTIGSLQPYKGQPFLIGACALLRDQGLDFRCRIIGGGEDHALLQDLITQHNLGQHVELLGGQPEDAVARLLPTADCYVQPSIITESGKMEGIPVALMEAMACGLPVVASELSGIPELVRPGETGYLVPPADSVALAAALAHVAANRVEAAERGANGRQRVLDEFNLQTNVAQLSELLERISPALSQHAGHPLPQRVSPSL